MHIPFLVIIVVIVEVLSRDKHINFQEYCNLACPRGTQHTVCEFRCELSPDCHGFREYELSFEEQQLMLDVHNYYRSLVASGHDSRGGNGAGRDMLALTYDVEMEIPVSCWGRRCIFDHDKCRHTPKYKNAGQNLFLESSSSVRDPTDLYYINVSVASWYNEIDHTSSDIIESFHVASGGMIGHFTQLVWARTAFIACTRVTYTYPYEPIFKYQFHLLCNYSPAGNVFTLPVYRYGRGCANRLIPDTRFIGLCLTPQALREREENDIKKRKSHEDKVSTTMPPTHGDMKSTTPRETEVKVRSCETRILYNKNIVYLLMLLFI